MSHRRLEIEKLNIKNHTAYSQQGTFVCADHLPNLVIDGVETQSVGVFFPQAEAQRQTRRAVLARHPERQLYEDTVRAFRPRLFSEQFEFMAWINLLMSAMGAWPKDRILQSTVSIAFLTWYIYTSLSFDDLFAQDCDDTVTNTLYYLLLPQIIFGITNLFITSNNQLNQFHQSGNFGSADSNENDRILHYDDNGIPFVRLHGRHFIVMVDETVAIDQEFQLARLTPVDAEQTISDGLESISNHTFEFSARPTPRAVNVISETKGFFAHEYNNTHYSRHFNGLFHPLILPRELRRQAPSRNYLQRLYAYLPEWLLNTVNRVSRYPTVNKALLFFSGKFFLNYLLIQIHPAIRYKRNNTIGCSASQLHLLDMIFFLSECVMMLLPDGLTNYHWNHDRPFGLPDNKQPRFSFETDSNSIEFMSLRFENRFYRMNRLTAGLSIEFLYEKAFRLNNRNLRLLIRLPKPLLNHLCLVLAQIRLLHHTQFAQDNYWHQLPNEVRTRVYDDLFHPKVPVPARKATIDVACDKGTLGYNKSQFLLTLFSPHRTNQHEVRIDMGDDTNVPQVLEF